MSQASVLQTVIQPKSPHSDHTVRPLTMTPPVGLDDEVLGNDPDDLEAILSVLVENAPVAMAMFDRHMRYLLANRQWVTDFGLQNEMPLVGRGQFEVLPNLHPGWRSVYDRALKGHVVRNEHDIMQDPTGQPVIFRWEVRPWRRGKESAVGGLMVTCEKFAPIVITKEVPAESAPPTLQAPPVRVPDAAEGLQQCELPVMEVDMDGVIHRANPAAIRLAAQPIQVGDSCLWESFAALDAAAFKRDAISAIASAIGSDGLAPASVVTLYQQGDARRVLRWAITNAPAADDDPRVMLIGIIYDDTPSPPASSFTMLPPVIAPPVVVPIETTTKRETEFVEEQRRLEAQLVQATNELSLLHDMEQAYKRRELRQREVLDSMPCGLLVLDERGRPTFHNTHVRDLFGRELKPGDTVENWLALACLNKTHCEEITRIWRESVWRRQLTKIVSLSTADGLLKDFELRPVALPNNGLLVTIHDVTETSRLEEMLRSAEAKFRTVLHDSPVAAVLADASGAIFEANAAAERMLRHPRSELRRTSIDDWLGVDSIHERRAGFAKLASGSQSQITMQVELHLDSKSEHVPATMRIASIKDGEGRFHAAAHFIEPIQVAAPLAEAAPSSQAPSDVGVERWQPIVRATEQGRVLGWSEAASLLFGVNADEAQYRWLHQFFRPSDATGFIMEMNERLVTPETSFEWTWFAANGAHGMGEFRIQRAASVDEIELLAVAPSLLPPEVPAPEATAKEIIYVLAGNGPAWPVADLDRERLMLTETHHRIKNHLQLVSSFLSFQGNTLTDEAAKQALRSTQNRVRAVAALHHHLYQLALGQSASLQEFAEELISRLRECHGVPAVQVAVDLQLHDLHPREEWVMPIALVLNEAFSNCFNHAYANGRTGRIATRLTCDGGLAHLTVQDDGPGLPEDFEPGACLGLGLKVAGVFADQMKGKIHLKNIIPNGLLFDLQFPIGCVDI